MNETADHMTLGHQKLRYYLSWSQHFLNLKKKMTGDLSELIQHIYLDIYISSFKRLTHNSVHCVYLRTVIFKEVQHRQVNVKMSNTKRHR